MKPAKNRKWLTFIAIVCWLLVLPGCTKEEKAASSAAGNGKIRILVGTSGESRPFSYVDESNQLTGYDIDAVRAIFAKLPQYEAVFEVTEFKSIFAGLDSGRYQLGANNMSMNESRREKFLYSLPILENPYGFFVAAGRDDLRTFEDLKGKTVEVYPGTEYANVLERLNAVSGDQLFVVKYAENDQTVRYRNVENGRFDFLLHNVAVAGDYIQHLGMKVKHIPFPDGLKKKVGLENSYDYLITSKGIRANEKLLEDVNRAIRELQADGTFAKLSKKYFGGDYSLKN